MVKTAAVSVRVSDEIKDAMEKAAREQSRSTANLVELILREWLESKGYLKPPKK